MPKLLLVDDEEQFRVSLAKRLEMRGFDILDLDNGEDAIKVIRADSEIDVVVLDRKMPGMNGIDTLKLIKKQDPIVEVIMLTGHGSMEAAVECTKLGAFKYLEKPYEFEKLIDVIKEAYEHRLKKKFEHNEKRMDELQKLSLGRSPLGLLRALSRLDDDEK